MRKAGVGGRCEMKLAVGDPCCIYWVPGASQVFSKCVLGLFYVFSRVWICLGLRSRDVEEIRVCQKERGLRKPTH